MADISGIKSCTYYTLNSISEFVVIIVVVVGGGGGADGGSDLFRRNYVFLKKVTNRSK
jgi:hypothetical protein